MSEDYLSDIVRNARKERTLIERRLAEIEEEKRRLMAQLDHLCRETAPQEPPRSPRVAEAPGEVEFRGKLDVHQEDAVEKLSQHDIGVLVAPTAFGKTVVAARLIAARGRNTLVVVHRQQLLEQWLERLATFLDIDTGHLGRIGGGTRKPSGVIDVALIQSLIRRGEVSDIVANYGHLVVDECHHLSAVNFEAVARASYAKFVLGVTATMARKDGRHPIVLMQ